MKIFSVPGWFMCGQCGHRMWVEEGPKDRQFQKIACANLWCSEHGEKYSVELQSVQAIPEQDQKQ